MQDISFTVDSGIGWVELNRPKALNALTFEMIKQLQQQLIDWRDNSFVNAVVVKTDNEKAFCAGGDIRMLYEHREDNQAQQQFFWHEYRLNHYIANYPKPYISLLNGITMGGGVGISLHGSHPIATEKFNFAMPETGIGFFPDIGGGFLLSRCQGAIGNYLGLTGKRIDRAQAVDAGLIKYTLDSEALPRFLEQLCHLSWGNKPHDEVDVLINQFHQQDEPSILQTNYDEINHCFSQDSVESIAEQLEKTKSQWSEKTLNALQTKSPTSLHVTLEQIKRARDIDLAECLKMEYRMVCHLMTQHDFYEGVRALIIDKDNKPSWQPQTIKEVTAAQVMAFFDANVSDLMFD